MKLARSVMSLGFLGMFSLCGIGCDKAADAVKKGEAAAQKAEKVIAEKSEKALEKGEELAKKGAAAAEQLGEEALAKAKEEYAKLTSGHFAEIEQKIKDLAAEKMTEAQALFEKAKEKAEALKDAAPEKFEEMKKEVSDLVAELKKKVGL